MTTSDGPDPEQADRSQQTKSHSKPKLKLNIAHSVPGRVRMKVKGAKGNPELLKQIGETFSVIPGVERVTVNPLTGSVVLHFNPNDQKDFDRYFDRHYRPKTTGQSSPPVTEIDLLASKISDEAEYLSRHSHTAKAVVDFFKGLDQEIKSATGNTVDLTIVLAVGIIGITILEIGATAATPVWLTLAVFTVNHLIELNQPYPPSAPTSAPVVVKTA
jgi:hypothetical protein